MKAHNTEESENLQNIGIESVLKNKAAKPYSPAGQEAQEFAREKLEENPEISEFNFRAFWNATSGTHQPTNTEIAKLTTLYWDVCFKSLEDAIKENKENPWSSPKVQNAADDLMKIAYAISALTLDDIKQSTEDLSAKGINRTYAEALTRHDSYQYRTFFCCTNAYHWIRSAITWSKRDHDGNEGLYSKNPIPESHATPFYEKGTMQNTWNTLYNDYCDRVRMYVKEEEFKSGFIGPNRLFVNWTQKDTGVESFKTFPDIPPN